MFSVHQLSQVLQVKISFFSHLFVSCNLAHKSKEVKCYQKWLKNGVKSEFYCPFLTPILMINSFSSSFLKKTAQLIHLTIDLSRLHQNLNSGKFE